MNYIFSTKFWFQIKEGNREEMGSKFEKPKPSIAVFLVRFAVDWCLEGRLNSSLRMMNMYRLVKVI